MEALSPVQITGPVEASMPPALSECSFALLPSSTNGFMGKGLLSTRSHYPNGKHSPMVLIAIRRLTFTANVRAVHCNRWVRCVTSNCSTLVAAIRAQLANGLPSVINNGRVAGKTMAERWHRSDLKEAKCKLKINIQLHV